MPAENRFWKQYSVISCVWTDKGFTEGHSGSRCRDTLTVGPNRLAAIIVDIQAMLVDNRHKKRCRPALIDDIIVIYAASHQEKYNDLIMWSIIAGDVNDGLLWGILS